MTKIKQEVREHSHKSKASLIETNESLRRQAVDVLLSVAEMREKTTIPRSKNGTGVRSDFGSNISASGRSS